MEMFQHDNATVFRFVLQGELTGVVVVDVSGITNAGPAGAGLLFRMWEAGTAGARRCPWVPGGSARAVLILR